MEIISKNLEETRDIAKKFLQNLKQPKERALVVGLFGDLGSGKTTFVQFIAEALGIEENITSPTFVIEKIYSVKSRRAGILPKAKLFNRASKIENFDWPKRLIHTDAYRLKNGEELRILGFEEILNDSGNLIMIEWPENIFSILPDNILKIEFEFVDENTRKINSNALT
ncbi:tRNA (adenosine(37)-N6)-threonylcarbamoyltransferase complex ATPase subunit type 1 TsaE [Patescibacteria group bacterium]|nr:tRNA (adenosine(37)-N6)-threonylcarbamoyltransferase complex ATPase subunit type 1 TsaE [Patescibacteria group bacterium]MBU4115655.1 tRNA (adenosine(37)-N6)-threonylcarbamoyltransferase complex ATPase subunit type 1 TsaE [Patescibacteria group bacterium]